MDARELRIGNWVTHNNEWCQDEIKGPFKWEERHWYQVAECLLSLENVEPIPLTPEILEKAGFENHSNDSEVLFISDSLMLGEENEKLFFCVFGENGLDFYGNEIKYVYQLQNLFFALTGEELEINFSE